MVGCLEQGCSRAIMDEVRSIRVRQTSLGWVSYPVSCFKDALNATTVVVQRLDQPSSGSGEPTTTAVPAAIANAFFDATGIRLYRMPMTQAYIRGPSPPARGPTPANDRSGRPHPPNSV